MRHIYCAANVFVVDAVGEVFVEFEGFFVFEGFIETVPQAQSSAPRPPRLVDVPQGLETQGDAFFAVAVALAFEDQRFQGDFVDLCFYRIEVFV